MVKLIESNNLYTIYAEGTWNNYRALFRRRTGAPQYSSEADADKFSEAEADRMCKSTGKYKWVKHKV